ncbi:MAG TPA: sigma-54 dependent transcriptional regulator [Polyangiaceae bacterium]|jgi:DNA-binding NtrC family response regulator|nr:sigma-54 dependent transcriptional regulator [Polyangiaceae bacterium]
MKAADFAVLVVDDDPMVVSTLRFFAEARGHAFTSAAGVAEAKRILGAQPVDVVLLDLYLPDGDGLGVLDHAVQLDSPPVVIVMTARAEIQGAVAAVRRGAADYLPKPLDLDDLGARMDRALENASMRRRLARLEDERRQRSPAIARSPALKEVLTLAGRVAATPASAALLIGESGVGKEVVASYIHEMSERREGPFVRVNLAAIPESMVEAELFGSVRGAFTDAKRDRAGHFASAEGGTLLLDEVCEFKTELQPKLLRALEERSFFPVGSDRERRMNVRFLAATNRDPAEMVARGLLREDLFYRLSTIVIRIPPLRERRDDILPLAAHFLERFRAELKRPRASFSAAAEAALAAHAWPGNVRELRNVVERAIIIADSETIGKADLGLPLPSTPPDASAAPLTLEEMEKQHIARVLQLAGGSKTRAASMLGVSRSTLWEKTKKYGID